MGPAKQIIVLGACLMALAGPAHGADLTPVAQKEITQLLERVEASNCSFNRNGTWYTAPDARKHLQLKLDYMVERKMLGTAEDFIANAASESSMSGKPYLMRCGNQEVVASVTWLNAELKRIRTPN